MGLPYVKDPAVTKHILKFLRYAQTVYNGELGKPLKPDFI
jgi:hypothetical protein